MMPAAPRQSEDIGDAAFSSLQMSTKPEHRSTFHSDKEKYLNHFVQQAPYPMSTSTPVKIGCWTNYGYATLYTVTEKWGTIWTIAVGVIVGLAWPWAKNIILRSWAWALYGKYHKEDTQRAEQQSLLAIENAPEHDSISEISSSDRSCTVRTKAIPWWPDIGLALLLFMAAISYGVAGGAIGEISASKLGLSDARSCGSWDLKSNVDQIIQDNDDLIQAKKEARAAQYGRDCYGEQSVANPDQCEFFERGQISYDLESVDCPFECPDPNRCICANGIYGSAIRLSTKAFSAGLIGLNGERLPLIRRTSTFVPLDIDHGFVVDKSEADLELEYHLGPVNASGEFRDYTFTMFGTPFDWDIPAYSISAYESSPSGSEYDAWQPISELARPSNTYMTAIFISPCRIIYSGRCEDYIFQATDELPSEDGWPPHRFYNQDPRARVLIAIDQMEVCPYEEDSCFRPDEEYPEFGVEYEMVRTALRRTSSFRSIRYRLGSALVAAESISDFESRQLDKEQWVIESKALFNTSLARLQFNMLDIATGDRPRGNAAAGYEDAYDDTTPSWAKGRMCEKYVFHLPSGYTNINILQSIGVLLLPFSLWLLNIKTPWFFKESKKPEFQGRMLLFDICILAAASAVQWIRRKVCWVIRKLRRQ